MGIGIVCGSAKVSKSTTKLLSTQIGSFVIREALSFIIWTTEKVFELVGFDFAIPKCQWIKRLDPLTEHQNNAPFCLQ